MTELISLEEAVKLLGVPTAQVLGMLQRGEVQGQHDGTGWKLEFAQVERMAEQTGVEAGVSGAPVRELAYIGINLTPSDFGLGAQPFDWSASAVEIDERLEDDGLIALRETADVNAQRAEADGEFLFGGAGAAGPRRRFGNTAASGENESDEFLARSASSHLDGDIGFEGEDPEAAAIKDLPTSENVQFVVYAPAMIKQDSSCNLRIWAFMEEQREEMHALATYVKPEDDKKKKRRWWRWKRKRKPVIRHRNDLAMCVTLDGIELERTIEVLRWNREVVSATIPIKAPEDCRPGIHVGSVRLFYLGLQIAELTFMVQVGGQQSPPTNVTTEIRRTKAVFASYVIEDEKQVLRWAQKLEKVGIEVFHETPALRKKDNWRLHATREIAKSDMYCLFWSKAFSESETVDGWEWGHVIETAGWEKVQLYPLVNTRKFPPPDELMESGKLDDIIAIGENSKRLPRRIIFKYVRWAMMVAMVCFGAWYSASALVTRIAGDDKDKVEAPANPDSHNELLAGVAQNDSSNASTNQSANNQSSNAASSTPMANATQAMVGNVKRLWSDKSGIFSVEATFVDYDGETVTLQRADNQKLIRVGFDLLSEDDRNWIQKRLQNQN